MTPRSGGKGGLSIMTLRVIPGVEVLSIANTLML